MYLYGLILLFLICLPVALFFASGYNFRNGFGFIKTGGIFISVPYAGADVSINGEAVGTSGIVKRGFYIDNLAPSSYEILVTREGLRPWHRTLVVEENLVSDTRAFLIPNDIRAVLISYGAGASTTKVISKSEYDLYKAAFYVKAATSTRGAYGESVFIENGNVFVRLGDESVLQTSNFCGRPSYCVKEIPIENGAQKSLEASFFGGGVVYATKEEGVFLAEADIRPTPSVSPVYPRRGAIFRIIDGKLIVKNGNKLYEIEGL
ncbi:hypothetical protein A3C86_01295 [Candidatus Kaiserbacteria bacterium RIFCSPHIGHO2_02_FULL_49_16]|uniref:PEGA domain-containing protein n=1 Tax=Candidatus Kaiserbacteria bacterium RIFCSPHIGHO2_02_FULL_49_16 TaxID=1798490 RepID=A0A1F6DDA2_9BACT|nr:MAG: hypothetical protein A3C86_01295 [Candidatus Kaiserbacteria bacterium RIFCSPHIGHO2_02_FULL_49_16]